MNHFQTDPSFSVFCRGQEDLLSKNVILTAPMQTDLRKNAKTKYFKYFDLHCREIQSHLSIIRFKKEKDTV